MGGLLTQCTIVQPFRPVNQNQTPPPTAELSGLNLIIHAPGPEGGKQPLLARAGESTVQTQTERERIGD